MTVGTLSIDWLPVGLLLGAAVGLVSTVGMDLPMNRLPEGPTAPRVAAGTLSDATLDAAPDGVATAAHYGAGVGTGVLFLSGVAAARWLLDAGALVVVSVTAVALFILMNWFFSFVVVPTYGRVPDGRVETVRRDWRCRQPRISSLRPWSSASCSRRRSRASRLGSRDGDGRRTEESKPLKQSLAD